MIQCNDMELWELFLHGDRVAFTALYTSYYKDLLYFGSQWTGDGELVKDTINQQFLHLWDKKESLPSVHNVRSYILTAFRNRLSNETAKVHPHAGFSSFDETASAPSWEDELMEVQEKNRVLQTLKVAIAALPERQRELVFLRYYQGLSTEAIAEKTGLASSTVYNTLHAALNTLRKQMSPKHAGQLQNLLSLLFMMA